MASKTAINAFENQLQNALKEASIRAAASLFATNPGMTLEDFYSVMRPQGVTESITIGEMAAAISGNQGQGAPGLMTRRASQPRSAAPNVEGVSPQARPSKPKKLSNVDCRTTEGRAEYHAVVLAYLAWVGDWVTGPEILKNCGGDRNQLGAAMRTYLVPNGLAFRKGHSFGMRYKIGKGKSQYKQQARTTTSNGKVTARTIAGKLAYRAKILKFMHGNKWWSGKEISRACGGNAAQRKRMLNNLIEEGVVEHNGESTTNVRYRIKRKAAKRGVKLPRNHR